MKLFTREEKRNKELIDEYEKFISKGMNPRKAVKKAREAILENLDK